MKRATWVWTGALLLTAGALGTASCGSSNESDRSRDGGGAGGEGGVAGSSSAGAPGSGGSGAPLGTAGHGGDEVATSGAGGMGLGGVLEAGAPNKGGESGAAGGSDEAGGAGGAAPALRLVYNTGVDDSGVALPGGSVDPHYTLLSSPDATYPGPDAIVATHIAEGYWLAPSATSMWIAPTPNQSYPGADPCNATGIYVWRTTFDLTGLDPDTFVLNGGWATDNYGTEVMLNGVDTGITTPGYGSLAPFTLTSGFVAGVNTLDFEVTDVGCPNGLRVELSADTGAGGAGGAGSL